MPETPPADSAAESDTSGRFVRQQSGFRQRMSDRPEAGRVHLYISLACPWASRALIVRNAKGLQELVPVTVVDPIRDERGWRFMPQEPDPINGFTFLSEAYYQSDPGYAARVTVPVLYDRAQRRIISNESADIIEMFDAWGGGPELYPGHLRAEMDPINDRIYENLNNGVYQAGFATTQAAYEEAFVRVFATLDWLEQRLSTRRYLLGDRITLADWRLFPTLVRFDAVYVSHFKCNLRRIADYEHLSGYLRDLYQQPGVADTVDMDHIKRHYYGTHPQVNPTRIVPKGPELDFLAPHGRERLSAEPATMRA